MAYIGFYVAIVGRFGIGRQDKHCWFCVSLRNPRLLGVLMRPILKSASFSMEKFE
jgi:hypothetical protein